MSVEAFNRNKPTSKKYIYLNNFIKFRDYLDTIEADRVQIEEIETNIDDNIYAEDGNIKIKIIIDGAQYTSEYTPTTENRYKSFDELQAEFYLNIGKATIQNENSFCSKEYSRNKHKRTTKFEYIFYHGGDRRYLKTSEGKEFISLDAFIGKIEPRPVLSKKSIDHAIITFTECLNQLKQDYDLPLDEDIFFEEKVEDKRVKFVDETAKQIVMINYYLLVMEGYLKILQNPNEPKEDKAEAYRKFKYFIEKKLSEFQNFPWLKPIKEISLEDPLSSITKDCEKYLHSIEKKHPDIIIYDIDNAAKRITNKEFESETDENKNILLTNYCVLEMKNCLQIIQDSPDPTEKAEAIQLFNKLYNRLPSPTKLEKVFNFIAVCFTLVFSLPSAKKSLKEDNEIFKNKIKQSVEFAEQEMQKDNSNTKPHKFDFEGAGGAGNKSVQSLEKIQRALSSPVEKVGSAIAQDKSRVNSLNDSDNQKKKLQKEENSSGGFYPATDEVEQSTSSGLSRPHI